MAIVYSNPNTPPTETMNTTPTPRTNDQSVRYYDDATGTRIEYVAARFARQLERELAQRERELAETREEIIGWREAAYALGEALPPSWETLQPPAEQLRKFKEMVTLQNEKTKNLRDIADKHSKMYP